MTELLREDDNHMYELEQNLFKIGDVRVGIEESNLQSQEAREIRTQGLILLHNASVILDGMYQAELAYIETDAENNNSNEETE